MQDGSLNCSATNCSHNFGYKCKAGAIDVSGGSASCRTFEDRAGRSFVNSLNDYFTTETSNIKCEALNCVHNENKGCYADDVQIDFTAYNQNWFTDYLNYYMFNYCYNHGGKLIVKYSDNIKDYIFSFKGKKVSLHKSKDKNDDINNCDNNYDSDFDPYTISCKTQ